MYIRLPIVNLFQALSMRTHRGMVIYNKANMPFILTNMGFNDTLQITLKHQATIILIIASRYASFLNKHHNIEIGDHHHYHILIIATTSIS